MLISSQFAVLDGSMSAAERHKESDRPQNEKKTGLFLLSLKAGEVGINLTEADHMGILYPR